MVHNYTEQMAIERDDRTAINLITADLHPGDVFVDIGANCGLFTVFAGPKVGPTGKVLAIEPIPEMARRLKFHVAANAFGNVAVCEKAVGSQPCRQVTVMSFSREPIREFGAKEALIGIQLHAHFVSSGAR